MNLGQEIPNENFTQKDLMLHLLQVSQHTVTREDIKEDIAKVEVRFDKVDKKIENLATKEELTKVETSLTDKFDKMDLRFDKMDKKIENLATKEELTKVESSLKADISKVETSLKVDNVTLMKRMDRFIFWSLGLTITSTFLILTLMYKMMPN